VNFNYFISEDVFRYIVEAVALVADEGWKLLPDYRFDPATGRWRHRNGAVEPPLRLSHLRYDADGTLRYPRNDDTAAESELAGYLAEARRMLAGLPDLSRDLPGPSEGVSADFEHLRWFDLPAVCLEDSSSC